MGSKSDAVKESALNAQNLAYQKMFADQQAATKATPYEEALGKEGLDWLNATNGKTPANVSTLPGMSPYLDVYDTAAAKQQGQRYGIGSLKMGAAFANPNLLSALQTQDQSHRVQDAGAQLEGAYKARDAAVRGMAMPIINVGAQRDATKLGADASMAENSTNAWAQHKIGTGFWGQLLNTAVAGAGQAATGRL